MSSALTRRFFELISLVCLKCTIPRMQINVSFKRMPHRTLSDSMHNNRAPSCKVTKRAINNPIQ